MYFIACISVKTCNLNKRFPALVANSTHLQRRTWGVLGSWRHSVLQWISTHSHAQSTASANVYTMVILALCQETRHKFTFKFILVYKRLYSFRSYSFKLLCRQTTLNTFTHNFHIRLDSFVLFLVWSCHAPHVKKIVCEIAEGATEVKYKHAEIDTRIIWIVERPNMRQRQWWYLDVNDGKTFAIQPKRIELWTFQQRLSLDLIAPHFHCWNNKFYFEVYLFLSFISPHAFTETNFHIKSCAPLNFSRFRFPRLLFGTFFFSLAKRDKMKMIFGTISAASGSSVWNSSESFYRRFIA